MSELNVLVCVCTYNEEKNIRKCISRIKKNGCHNILVVDAGVDNTRIIAEKCGAKVITSEKGLALQRQRAIDYCNNDFLAFIDADDRIKSDCISTLVDEINENNYDAIGATVRVYKPCSYWHKAIDATWRYSMFKPGPTNMVGRPAVYRASAIKKVGADVSFSNIGDEDTAISVRMERAGFRQGIGRGITYRICHPTFKTNFKEWIKYGKGDANVIKMYPDKKKPMIIHNLVEYPIIRSWDLIKNGKIKYVPYPICIGLVRFVVMMKYYFARKLG